MSERKGGGDSVFETKLGEQGEDLFVRLVLCNTYANRYEGKY